MNSGDKARQVVLQHTHAGTPVSEEVEKTKVSTKRSPGGILKGKQTAAKPRFGAKKTAK